MQQAQVLHIVDGSSRSRAEQARKGFELGLHCEVYSDAAELLAAPPQRGVVLARDDEGEGSAQEVISTLATLGEWVPVVATSVDPRPTKVVEAIECGALDYLRLPLRDGRLMAIGTHNTDIFDGWEREAYGSWYFERFSTQSYRMGVNVLTYVLTH